MKAPCDYFCQPTWTSSAKDMVGTSLGPARVWFTLGYGILNEVYYPRIDIPQIRDLGFIVADGEGFWLEVKRVANYRLSLAKPGVPAVEIIHSHASFELQLRVCPDPLRDVVLIDVDLKGDAGLKVYALLAPHLGGEGYHNEAWVGRHNGRSALWAEKSPFALALMANDDSGNDCWQRASAGCVGRSDGWQDFSTNSVMTWTYDAAGPGNVALMGELPQKSTLALGFGGSKESAATLALSSLAQSFDNIWQSQISDWHAWHGGCSRPTQIGQDLSEFLQLSALVLKTHQDRTYPGAMVASLSIPWGNANDSPGGYHLVWSRDLVESAGALLALGEISEAQNVLRYLIASQRADGHWLQNQWLGGTPFWEGVQLDEAGFPVLLVAALKERDALDDIPVSTMVKRALTFIAREGPITGQDRWEEDSGINPFTIAVLIAALVCGAEFLDEPARSFALQLADTWNASLETWTYAEDTDLARQLGIAGYYIRNAPLDSLEYRTALGAALPIKNRIQDPGLLANEQIAGDFLQLVRFGLRRADDSCITNSVKALDALLKVETPYGPVWHRYNGDGYGERPDGSPFDGWGLGRGWPLLTGERGHYALAKGEDALPYLRAMMAMTGPGGMIPEQVWDTTPIPERALFPGKPSGSAMPLVWAHGEWVKLLYSYILGRPFDRPESVWQRYRGLRPEISWVTWRYRNRLRFLPKGKRLRIELLAPATVHWGIDGWKLVRDVPCSDSGLGVYFAELTTDDLNVGQNIEFTFYWLATETWEGQNFQVLVS